MRIASFDDHRIGLVEGQCRKPNALLGYRDVDESPARLGKQVQRLDTLLIAQQAETTFLHLDTGTALAGSFEHRAEADGQLRGAVAAWVRTGAQYILRLNGKLHARLQPSEFAARIGRVSLEREAPPPGMRGECLLHRCRIGQRCRRWRLGGRAGACAEQRDQ